jgi:Na+-translocating ferredoxin:NAD+ oxidoreductase subunit G
MVRPRASLAPVFVLLSVTAANAQITREEALSSVFPGATIRQEQVFLTTAQQQQMRARGADTAPALVARYLAVRDGQPVGRAYVDTHTVRTKRESLLISLDQSGRVKRVDVTAFLEPREYLASEAWLRQYRDRALSTDLAVNRAIRPMAGATLTTRAVNAAVRRVLALDEVLRGEGGR